MATALAQTDFTASRKGETETLVGLIVVATLLAFGARPRSTCSSFVALHAACSISSLVLAGFAVIRRAFAYGGRTPQFEIASGLLIVLIGAFLLWRSASHDHTVKTANGRMLAFATGMIPCPLTTFIMSYALARGLLGAGLVVTAAMTVGMIATIGGIALLASLARPRFMLLLARTENVRHNVGRTLEILGSLAVLGFGAWTILQAWSAA